MQELLDAVRAVVLELAEEDADGARRVSTRRYNAARADAPSAQAVCARLGLPWDRVLWAALTEPAERGHLLGHLGKRPDADWDDDLARRALRAAAHRVGAPLTASAYDDAIEQLDRGARAGQGAPLRLPHSATLVARFGSWAAACRWAGVAPATQSGPPVVRAEPAVEILDRFVSETGLLPDSGYFRCWCRAQGIPLGRDGRAHRRVVAALRDARTARGEATPTSYARPEELPLLPDETRDPDRGPGGGYTREAILASLRRYGERHLAPGTRPRFKDYQAACRRDPELLSTSCLGRHGRFQGLCREAGI